MNKLSESTAVSLQADHCGTLALVTGCAGFIGSHLCGRLLDRGVSVVGVDSLTNYYDPALKHRNLDTIRHHPGFKFIGASIQELGPELVKQVDWIFHLAAQPGVRGSWGVDFGSYVTNNIVATQNLLEKASASISLKKFVYASSSSVYGDIDVEKVSEDHRTAPFSPYGVTKLAAEQLCSVYGSNFGLPVVALRFFTVYGPRQRPDMAFYRLVSAALNAREFPLYGDGSQQRDFTFVGDIVCALLLAAEADKVYGVFNIGGGHVVSMSDVIALVERLSGLPVRVVRKASQAGDVRRTSADVSKAHEQLGYVPKTSLESGLAAQIEQMSAITAL